MKKKDTTELQISMLKNIMTVIFNMDFYLLEIEIIHASNMLFKRENVIN